MKRTVVALLAVVALALPLAAQAATPGQNNAKRAAEQYLQLTAFSRKGLIQQLKIGDGYTTAQATWAVNHIHVNYDAEAVKSAKQYLKLTAFSRSGLVQQLEIGDGYTVGQAKYGVAHGYH